MIISFHSILFPCELPNKALMNFFITTHKIPLYIQPFILKWGSNSNIVIKMIPFISFYVTPKQGDLHSIHFHSFILKHPNNVT